MVLARLFQLVESGQVTAPIFDPASVPDSSVSNAVYVKQYTLDLLTNAFPHIQQFVQLLVLGYKILTENVDRKSATSCRHWVNPQMTSSDLSLRSATSLSN